MLKNLLFNYPLLIKSILKIIFYLYLGALVGVFLFQRFIFLHPVKLPLNHKFKFEAQEFNVISNDNQKLNALVFRTKDLTPKGVILYIHGNSDNLDRWGQHAQEFTKRGYDVVMYDFRGFGKSEGRLDEENLLRDAQLFYEDISTRYQQNQIIVYGRSLGTGPAAKLAMDNTPKMLILETPYYSIEDLSASYFPFFPYKKMFEFKIPTYQWLANVHLPIHIFHGTSDNIVPYKQSLKLMELLKKKTNATLTTLKDGEHRGLEKFKEYQSKMDELLDVKP